MQTTSALYKQLLAAPLHECEWRLDVGGVSYGAGDRFSMRLSSALFSGDAPAVGACVAGELTAELLPKATIPRMAEIKVYVRLTEGTQASEWLPMGVYYIDTRSISESGSITLHGYDAMLKAEQIYLAEDDTAEWPQTMAAVVSSICTRMGVSLDSRTVLKGYTIDYPEGYTMREILGYIAAAHGGCWIMTPAGKLRLVTLGGLPVETNYLIDESGDAITFGGDHILV